MVHYQKHRKPLFRRRSNLVKLLQAGLDVLGVSGLFYELLLHRLGEVTPDEDILLLILALIMLVCYEYFGMYRSNANIVNKTAMLFRVWSISFMGFISAVFLTHQGDDYSGFFLLELYLAGFVVQMGFHALVKLVHHQLVRHSTQTSQALIVGNCPLAKHLRHKISSNLWMGERVVGLVALSEHSNLSAEAASEANIIGGLADLPGLVDEYGVDVVYVVTPLALAGVLGQIYPLLLDKYVTIHWIPDIFSLRLVNHAVTELAGIPVLTLSETPLTGLNRLAKLIEDRVLSGLILLLIAPILLVVAILVKLDSPGPVFYRQKRAGWSGKIFWIWKFRSMYVQPEGETAVVKQAEKNDSRVTRVGRFIRKTSLDELPQIFNVLLGDMSLVGPRPHAIQHDLEYSQRISDYFARHHIKPGITGLAQVRGFRGETKDITLMMRRVESDIEYINQWSIWLDIWILLRTIKVFGGSNAY